MVEGKELYLARGGISGCCMILVAGAMRVKLWILWMQEKVGQLIGHMA